MTAVPPTTPATSPARTTASSAAPPDLGALEPARLSRAKAAYATRHVDLGRAESLLRGVVPQVGDLVLARVVELGQHPRIERGDGRRAALFPGDEVVVVYGHRYAPDQFEAVVPGDLGECHLVAAGGPAGRVVESHGKMRPATTLAPVGLLADSSGRRISRLFAGATTRGPSSPTGRRRG